jgi:hypothetical protein
MLSQNDSVSGRSDYFCIEVSERTLLPGDEARLGETRFETWLSQPTSQILNRTHPAVQTARAK